MPYSTWLARQGCEAHHIDPVPKYVEQAKSTSHAQRDSPIVSILEGYAGHLERDDKTCDAVLLMGPLYHLVELSVRIQVLRQAHRVRRCVGMEFAKAVSRYGVLKDGLRRSFIDDPDFITILNRELTDGRYLPSLSSPYFTTAYVNKAHELREEVREAGFATDEVVAIQGLGKSAIDLEERW